MDNMEKALVPDGAAKPAQNVRKIYEVPPRPSAAGGRSGLLSSAGERPGLALGRRKHSDRFRLVCPFAAGHGPRGPVPPAGEPGAAGI